MSSNSDMLKLPARLKASEAKALKTMLAERAGTAVKLDAADVTYLGALCLQVLLSARRSWSEKALEFELLDPSEAVRTALGVFGVAAADIGCGEAGV